MAVILNKQWALFLNLKTSLSKIVYSTVICIRLCDKAVHMLCIMF